MKILWGLPGSKPGWERAAIALGHELVHHDPNRPYDGFLRSPDLAVLHHQQVSRPVRDQLDSFKGKLVLMGDGGIIPEGLKDRVDLLLLSPTGENWAKKKSVVYRPALDAPPNMPSGTRRDRFVCDVCFVGDYHEGIFHDLRDVCQSGLSVKLFGRGHPFHQCVGTLNHEELADAYASAGVSLDLELSPEKGLAIYAAGGALVSNRRYLGTGIDCLEHAPRPHGARGLVDTIETLLGANTNFSSRRDEVLSQHTYQHRLEEILHGLE